jgi:hypothetical protein
LILAHGFGGFSPWSVGPVAFGPLARQPIVVRNTWWSPAAHLMAAREKSERQEVAGVPMSPSRA